jgi:hypothetical protein
MSALPTNPDHGLALLENDGLRLRKIFGAATSHLLVAGVPFVTPERTLGFGTLYCPLEFAADGRIAAPRGTHQCWWIGPIPHTAAGSRFDDLISDQNQQDKGDGITVQCAFSRRPDERDDYLSYYEKIWTYIEMLWGEARKVTPECKPDGFKEYIGVATVVSAQRRVFRYPDMATTRAGIGAMSEKLMLSKVAIVGLGGTGSYILDLVAKTLVGEIHLFDDDDFEMHCAFRAPGAAPVEIFPTAVNEVALLKKVEWYSREYGRMHTGIIPHPYKIAAGNVGELADMDFVFVSVDDSPARAVIIDALVRMERRFVDVGMDMEIEKRSRKIGGTCRVTSGRPGEYAHIRDTVPMEEFKGNDIYRNIQVADMNMLNAALAVGKWKKMVGFYVDDGWETNMAYTLDSNSLAKTHRR